MGLFERRDEPLLDFNPGRFLVDGDANGGLILGAGSALDTGGGKSGRGRGCLQEAAAIEWSVQEPCIADGHDLAPSGA